MNILHIIPNLRKGGAERLVLDICKEISSREAHKVLLVTFSHENMFPEFKMNFDWKVVKVEVRLSVLKTNKIDVSSLQEVIDEFQPNVIHTHLFMAELVSRFCDYPAVKWFSHGHDNMEQLNPFSLKGGVYKRKFTNWYEKRVLFKSYSEKGNHYVAISQNSESFLRKVVPKIPVTLLHNAINYDRFHNKKSEGDRSQLTLVNVGSLVNKKNQTFLIDVAEILQGKKVDFKMHLLGDGPNYNLLIEKVKSLGLNDQVILHGNVSNVEEFYWKSDIYIHSATYEPLGLVLIEAMAAGLPVITLDGKGNRDIIRQNQNGIMLENINAKEFVNEVLAIWTNSQQYCDMSSFAQEYAKQFNIFEYVHSLIQLYKS